MSNSLTGLEPKEKAMFHHLRFVMLMCVLLMVVNLVMGFWLWRLTLIVVVDKPIRVTCSGGRYSGSPQLPLAVELERPRVAPDLTAAGAVQAEFSFRATLKEPGSRYSLRYRLGEDDAWQETPAEEVGPLQYAAVAELATEPGIDLSYQAVARLGGEVIAASDIRKTQSDWLGDPALRYYVPGWQRDGPEALDRHKLVFQQHPRPAVEQWQVVALKVNVVYPEDTMPGMVEVDGRNFIGLLPNRGGFGRLEVEAEYGDGLVVEGEIKRADLENGEGKGKVLSRPRGADL